MLAYSRLLWCCERIRSVSDKLKHFCKLEWGHDMAKKVAGRRPVFDGSRLKKINWRKLVNAAIAAAQTVADLQEGGASPSKIAAALERWRKSRNELDGAILQDQQARVNQ